MKRVSLNCKEVTDNREGCLKQANNQWRGVPWSSADSDMIKVKWWYSQKKKTDENLLFLRSKNTPKSQNENKMKWGECSTWTGRPTISLHKKISCFFLNWSANQRAALHQPAWSYFITNFDNEVQTWSTQMKYNHFLIWWIPLTPVPLFHWLHTQGLCNYFWMKKTLMKNIT